MSQLNHTTFAGASAELMVAYRFLEAGRPVAWPLVPCPYDLVVDGGNCLYRVQVKRASARIKPGGTTYCYPCRITKNDKEPIPVSAFDILCAVADPGRIYVIPSGALHLAHAPEFMVTKIQIYENGGRFAPFLNQFWIGSGEVPVGAVVNPLRKREPRTFWHTSKTGQQGRKAHRRLSLQEIEAIKQLPIVWSKREAGPGVVTLEAVAHQFGVHVATLRNLLRGKRLDIKAQEGG